MLWAIFTKEKTMSRHFYHQFEAREHQREISRELANRHLLADLKREPISRRQAAKLMIRLVPAVIFMTILLAIMFG
jgi:hypothetical protein